MTETSNTSNRTNPKDFSYWWATWFASGMFPIAPGTAGTIASLPFWAALYFLKTPSWLLIVILISLYISGTWASEKAIRYFDNSDPKQVVIDEVVGQGITFLFISWSIPHFIIGFLLFRFFDVLKPWPISYFDKHIKGGTGIMFDDVIAGIFANICLQLGIHFL